MPLIKASERDGASLEGAPYEASVSLIIDRRSKPGEGPRLHRHQYDETWVVEEGNLTFVLGDERVNAGPGDIVIAPAGVPHKFMNDGPGGSSMICVHANPTIAGEWLE